MNASHGRPPCVLLAACVCLAILICGTPRALAQEEGRVVAPFTLPTLPYAEGDLAPYVSAETLQFHHGKHQQANVDAVNRLTAGKPEAEKTLEEIILSSNGELFNNSAQVWNHTFYWHSMKPHGGGAPTGELADAIARDFGSYAKFKEQFTKAAVSLFGSGWVWLVLDQGKLKIVQTPNADLPMKHNQTPLLVMDVWEHAYYIDYRNLRPRYVEAFTEHLANWDFAAANFAKAK